MGSMNHRLQMTSACLLALVAYCGAPIALRERSGK